MDKIMCRLLPLFLFVFFTFSTDAWAVTPDISAEAAILIDANSGEIYYHKNAEKRMSPASLTKVMTGILSIEMGKPKDTVEVGKRPHNVTVGSTMGLRYGDKLSLGDITKAALIMSANDATVAIAEHISKDPELFVEQMNLKAFTLGALNTRFRNTNGYTAPNHYSTAHDLALITRYALKNENFAKIVGTKETTVTWKNKKRELAIENSNRMLKDGPYHYPGTDGVKTGTTARAGNCLIASATREDRQLIAVVLRCTNRYRDAAVLLDYGFNEHVPRKIVRAGMEYGTIKVLNGVYGEVPIINVTDVVAVLSEADMECLEIFRYQLEEVKAPVQEGQALGRLVITCRGRLIDDVDLVAKQKIHEDNILNRLKHRFNYTE
ncbi:MAG TPA: D-alanyl-D-alanine carboxypeptidase family protein [Clostridia bacterium]|nr:D-alanyl-D-alanine carboxypeptidase family protein [Clostridia bacterium]